MRLCYLFSAKTARQLVNRKADFFYKTNRFESRIGMLQQLDSHATKNDVMCCVIASDCSRQSEPVNVMMDRTAELPTSTAFHTERSVRQTASSAMLHALRHRRRRAAKQLNYTAFQKNVHFLFSE